MTRWQLFGVLAAVVSLVTATAYALAPDPVQSVQYAVRATARTSFILFLAVFTASSLAKLLPSALTRALAQERRYIGLSFAFSHLLHAAVLIVYVEMAPEAFWVGRTPATNVPGYAGYLIILLSYSHVVHNPGTLYRSEQLEKAPSHGRVDHRDHLCRFILHPRPSAC